MVYAAYMDHVFANGSLVAPGDVSQLPPVAFGDTTLMSAASIAWTAH